MTLSTTTLKAVIFAIASLSWGVNARSGCGDLSPNQACYSFEALSDSSPNQSLYVDLTIDTSNTECTASGPFAGIQWPEDSTGYVIVAAEGDFMYGFNFPATNNYGDPNCFYPDSPNQVFDFPGMIWNDDNQDEWMIATNENNDGRYFISEQTADNVVADYVGSAQLLSTYQPTPTSSMPHPTSTCAGCDSVGPNQGCYHFKAYPSALEPGLELYLTVDYTQACGADGGYLVVEAQGRYSGYPGSIRYSQNDNYAEADNCFYPGSAYTGPYFDSAGLAFVDGNDGTEYNLFWDGNSYQLYNDQMGEVAYLAYDQGHCGDPITSSSASVTTTSMPTSTACYTMQAVDLESQLDLKVTVDYSEPCTFGDQSGVTIIDASGAVDGAPVSFDPRLDLGDADYCLLLSGGPNLDESGFDFTSPSVTYNFFHYDDGNTVAYALCTNTTGTGQCSNPSTDIVHEYSQVQVENVPCSPIQSTVTFTTTSTTTMTTQQHSTTSMTSQVAQSMNTSSMHSSTHIAQSMNASSTHSSMPHLTPSNPPTTMPSMTMFPNSTQSTSSSGVSPTLTPGSCPPALPGRDCWHFHATIIDNPTYRPIDWYIVVELTAPIEKRQAQPCGSGGYPIIAVSGTFDGSVVYPAYDPSWSSPDNCFHPNSAPYFDSDGMDFSDTNSDASYNIMDAEHLTDVYWVSGTDGFGAFYNLAIVDPGNASISISAAPTSSGTTSLSTSTVFATTTYTITSCAPTITNCPAHMGSVTTETIALYTTVCPVTESTIYQTTTYTLTSCAAEVPDCPARTSTAVLSTVTVVPVSPTSPSLPTSAASPPESESGGAVPTEKEGEKQGTVTVTDIYTTKTYTYSLCSGDNYCPAASTKTYVTSYPTGATVTPGSGVVEKGNVQPAASASASGGSGGKGGPTGGAVGRGEVRVLGLVGGVLIGVLGVFVL